MLVEEFLGFNLSTLVYTVDEDSGAGVKQLLGNLPDESAAGLKFELSALASQAPRPTADAEADLIPALIDQSALKAYVKNVSWTWRRLNASDSNLFGGLDQLFVPPANKTSLSVNGSFAFEIAPDRHGVVLFRTELTGPVDTYFTCRGGSAPAREVRVYRPRQFCPEQHDSMPVRSDLKGK